MSLTTPRACNSRTITVAEDRHIHIEEWPGWGDPIVFLHGLMGRAQSWSAIASVTGRRCVAVDLPGFGRSTVTPIRQLTGYAHDIATALTEFGVGSCVLVGHSFGGGVATALAEQLGERVSWLVLCAPAGFGRLTVAELAALPLVRDVTVRVGSSVLGLPGDERELTSNGEDSARARRHQRFRSAAQAAPLRRGLQAALETLSHASRSDAAFHRRPVAYAGPVTAIWGARDSVVPSSHILGLRNALPQTRLHIWPESGHHPQHDNTARLARVLEAATPASLRRSWPSSRRG